MNDREQNQLDAAQVTYDYLQQKPNIAIWSPLEAFADSVTALQGSLNILHTLAQIQAGQTEGITANKDRLRQSVATRLVNAAKACLSFGQASGNDDLVAQANPLNSKSEIKQIRDGALVDRAQAFYNKAAAARDADPATAAKYGLKTGADDKLLAPLQSAITAYSAVVGGPQAAINARAMATSGIGDEIRRLQALLKTLDNLIPQFEEDNADFVAGYHQARQVIARGSSGGGSGAQPRGQNPTPPANS